MALLLGLLCGGASTRAGRLLLPLCTGLASLWVGTQVVYYHLFRAFLTIFSITKMAMVAQSFGEMAVGNVLANWFPILMMAAPTALALWFRERLIPDGAPAPRQGARVGRSTGFPAWGSAGRTTGGPASAPRPPRWR